MTVVQNLEPLWIDVGADIEVPRRGARRVRL